jgi:hypothetical protein
MSATLDERNAGGYSVAYARDDTYFPVYVTAALAAIFLTVAWITGAIYWLLPAVAAAGFTYYNIPVLETGRPTIGANQYGIFIQAFGLIRWRAIERIDVAEIAERAMTVHELQIVLNAPLRSALVVDWRKQPMHRLLMAHGPRGRGTDQSGAIRSALRCDPWNLSQDVALLSELAAAAVRDMLAQQRALGRLRHIGPIGFVP